MLQHLLRLSKDSLAYGIAGALSRFSSLILLPLFTSYFTTEQYGIYQSVTNLGALLLAITILGLDGATGILYFSNADPNTRKAITTIWILSAVIVSLPVTLVLLVCADWLSLITTGTRDYAGLFRLGVAALPFAVFNFVTNNILRFVFKARAYAFLNIGQTVLAVGAIAYFLTIAHMELEGALWGTLISTAIVAIAGAWIIRYSIEPRLLNKWTDIWAKAKRMLQLGLPLVPASVALWITNFSNTYFLFQLAGPGSAGVFRIGAQLAALLSLVIWAFQLAWGPYSLSIAREPDAPRIFSRIATLFTAGTVAISVLLSAGAPIVLHLLTTKAYSDAGSVIGLLSLATAASGVYQVVAIGANLAQRTGPIAWTAIAAAVTNIILNIALIPWFGIVGAGISSLIANMIAVTSIYVSSQKLYPLPYKPLSMIAIWVTGGICVATSGTINSTANPSTWISLGVALLLLIFFVVALFVFRVISANDLAGLRIAIQRVMAKRRSA